jgi:protein-S-isoprenylcysteine O-methyltransferase Ste14
VPEDSGITWATVARRIRVPVGFAFAALYLWLARPTGVSILGGAAFIALGVLVRALASGQLNKNEQLAVGGPYAYTRNPLYLGSLVLALGFAIAARSLS